MLKTLAAGLLCVLALTGCGGDGDPETGEAAVKAWGEAVNAGDWSRACELTHRPADDCEADLRKDLDKFDLAFDGPAASQEPGNGESFSFSAGRGTVFVAAIPGESPRYGVRLEAIVLPPDA